MLFLYNIAVLGFVVKFLVLYFLLVGVVFFWVEVLIVFWWFLYIMYSVEMSLYLIIYYFIFFINLICVM